MTRLNSRLGKTERKVFQLLIAVLAVICFVPGGASTFGGINTSAALAGGEMIFNGESMLRGFVDNQYRFGFGVFFTQGLVLLFFLRNIEQYATLFRFSALALFIGGVGRATNILEYGVVDPQVVGPTVIELLVIPVLVVWHMRILNLKKA
ncbi:DUF4345 domain-containing protein [Thalassomonas actiniarum]|uniref:DUF4345 domain-containing protein n=1 Tax=Thalassomonas actiniarum TaxID=485447 RepID=A0AAF0C218_9GAMM|nr:DUF4345 domain-containing protein [Thalassomonas actiniarum]WDD97538.1 DUF4345 domain-containing protein [Thalassomonas actiniarum]